MNVVIVEDEVHARKHLRHCLSKHADVNIVGSCSDGRSAIESILSSAPDVLFLDIRIPEPDGFGVLRALPQKKLPIVVFVTAFSDFAVQAFEINACDYILKPFENSRIDLSLDRVRNILSAGTQHDELKKLVSLLEHPLSSQSPKVLSIKSKGKVLLLPFDDIDSIESHDDYIRINSRQHRHIVHMKLHQVLTLLPHNFVQIHRSTIVNCEKIRELRSLLRGDYEVVLLNGTTLRLSRTYRPNLDRHLSR